MNECQLKGNLIMQGIYFKPETYYKNQVFQISKWFLSLVLFLWTSSVTAQWDKQSPLPTHLDVRGVGAPTSQRVFIATDDNSFDNGGSLFESTDGGATWVQLNIPFTLGNPFNGLFFLDSQYGWVYGNENYRTTDGGTNWTQLPPLGSTYFMKFYSTTFGLTTGNFDRYVSYDGGDSWVPSPNAIFAFDFIDNLIGLGVSETGIYRTTDGGNNFTLVQAGNAESVVFLSDTNAISIVDGNFYRSIDGGVSWNVGLSANGKTELLMVTNEVLLAYGRTGTWPNYDDSIFRSTDTGQTWTNIGEVAPEGIFAFTINELQFVIASDFIGNMFCSTDLGLTWTQTFSSHGQQPSFLSSASPHFGDAQTGYFGYGHGFVIKTTDAGASWFQISSGTGESLNDVDRFVNGNLIAVGDNGTLLTSNGISQWVIHEKFSQYDLKAVQIISGNDVVVVDEVSQVYKSTDAGTTWSAAGAAPPNLDAEDLDFSSLQDGWVIGSGSIGNVLFHTTDGGISWTAASGFGGAYKAIDFEGTNGWALNIGGRYYYTTNGGVEWTQAELPGFPFQVADMDFINSNVGYAVGFGGYAARSNDGGITWEVLPTPNTNDNFTDIYLIGINELWVSTNDDVAYYSATGGQSWSVLDIGSAGFGSFSAIAAVPGGDAWVVGFQGYIERFIGPPPPPANQLPTASFEFESNGLTVDFIDTSIDPDGNIVSWDWNFGDGSGSTLQNPSHTYDTANTYIVSLTVTDNDGGQGNTGAIIVVQPHLGGTIGDFTEVTPLDSLFLTPQDEDFWVITTAPADYDNDGDLDIAVLGYYVLYNVSVEDKLVLLRNDGPVDSTEWDFAYIDIPLGSITAGSSDLSWGDLDGDGDQDLVVGSDGQTVIYRNDAGILSLIETNLPAYWEDNLQADFDLRSITWADFDNDGDLDLLLPSVYNDTTFAYYTALMRNDGPEGSNGWKFTSIDTAFAPTTHAQSSWADFDNDQDLDLLLINIAPLTDDGFIRRYRNEGNGIFVGEDILGSLSVEHGEGQWGDYDGDGDMDILIAGNIKETNGTYTHMALRIYRNDEENYVPVNVIDCIPCEGWFDLTAATWADYNSDGDMDILLAGTHNPGTGHIEGRARIYTNDGGIFTADTVNTLPAPRASGDRGGTFSWFDLDGDADLDYFMAGQYFVPGGNGLVEAQMHVYRNDVLELNEAPTIPSGLEVALLSENSVLLSWLPAIDDHTPTPAITYDIVIVRKGTHTPTKPGDVFNSNSASPLTRLPEPGNISAVTQWSLTGLQDGLYEWNLRAVDAAYVGSDIAVGEFSIGISTSGGPEDSLPIEYSIQQNYPNPFNPATTIRYSIPVEANVKLTIFNLLGEQLYTLVNKVQQAGVYELEFNASKLSSGIYIYRLDSGNFTSSRKLMLLK